MTADEAPSRVNEAPCIPDSDLHCARVLGEEVERLRAERDTPQIADFLKAVKLEALHQRERWGTEHDAGKAHSDWIWLLGHLAGKVLQTLGHDDRDKALHHTISSAAMLLNWHAAISGGSNAMRPGTENAR